MESMEERLKTMLQELIDQGKNAVSSKNTLEGQVKLGDHVLAHVPPGWMVAGTVVGIFGERLKLNDATYIEDIGTNHSVVELCQAGTAKELKEIATASWPLPDGTIILPMMVCQMVRDVRPLSKKKAAEAVELA